MRFAPQEQPDTSMHLRGKDGGAELPFPGPVNEAGVIFRFFCVNNCSLGRPVCVRDPVFSKAVAHNALTVIEKDSVRHQIKPANDNLCAHAHSNLEKLLLLGTLQELIASRVQRKEIVLNRADCEPNHPPDVHKQENTRPVIVPALQNNHRSNIDTR